MAPDAVNLEVQGAGSLRFLAALALIERVKPPVVITSVGPPREAARRVHPYGWLVSYDVVNLRHAAKAGE